LGRKVFAPGEVLTATNVQNYLMDQAVQVYAGTAARGSAIGSATTEGMISWLADTDQLQVATGTATWADVSFVQSPNAIINGGFDIWQRGTSFSSQGTIALGYSADRCHFYRDTGSTGATLSRQTSTLQGFQFAARIQRDSGNTLTTGMNIRQTVETSNSIRFAGQSVTFSFFARAGANYSATSQALNVVLATGTGVDQAIYSFTGYNEIINTSATLTTSWQRFTFTAPVGTSVTEIGFTIKATPTGTAGANDWFEITGVQLEAGSVATSFRRNAPSIQGELAACQRYYFRDTATSSAFTWLSNTGIASSTTNVIMPLRTPVPLRIEATSVEFGSLTLSDTVSNIAVTSLTLDANRTNNTSVLSVNVASGLTQFRNYIIRSNNSTAGYIGVSAEL
jgi:hypothetical protein